MTAATAGEAAHLFKPGEAVRVRRNVGQDTPFPPEVPHSLNPPDGALIYYWLASAPSGDVTIEILDSTGHVVRHMSSAAITPPEEFAHPPEPNFWLKLPEPLPAAAGLNRTNWNVRYDDPPSFSHSFAINANPGLTPASPEGPLALPGVYTVKLTVNGKSYSQRVTVRNDPRSPATALALRAQHALQMKIYTGIQDAWNAYQDADTMRAAIAAITNAPADADTAMHMFEARLDSVTGSSTGGRGGRGGGGFGRGGRGGTTHPTMQALNGTLVRDLDALDGGDMAPSPSMTAAWASSCKDLRAAATSWQAVVARDLPTLNGVLAKDGIKPVAPPKTAVTVPIC